MKRFYTHLFLLLFFLVGVTACQEELLKSNQVTTTSYIAFHTRSEVRGALVETLSDLPSVGVMLSAQPQGSNPPFTPNLMENCYLQASSHGGAWEYENPLPWPKDSTLSLCAYAPHTSDNSALTLGRGSTATQLSYTVPTDVTQQPDLMIARPLAAQEATGRALPLEMHHALTAIAFRLHGKPQRVTKIAFKNIYTTATVNINDPKIQWQSLQQSREEYCAGIPSEGVVATTNGVLAVNENGYLMMIPQTLPQGALLVVETDGVEKSIELAGEEWLAGDKIIYNLTPSSGWFLKDFSTYNYPSSNHWIIEDNNATADLSKYYEGLIDAITSVSKEGGRELIIEFPHLTEIPNGAIGGDLRINDLAAFKTLQLPLVETIGADAFSDCESLDSLYCPSLKTLGQEAFYNCDAMKRVYLPELITMASRVFEASSSLQYVSLPKAQTIGTSSFKYCDELHTVDFPEATTLGAEVFFNSPSLKEVNLPKVEQMGSGAFTHCKSLTTIELPQLKALDSSVFLFCSNLTHATLPKTTIIGPEAFKYCGSLETVEAPLVQQINTSAFDLCSSLKGVAFDQATKVDAYAFSSCSDLKTASFKNLKELGKGAFYYCTSLLQVDFPQLTRVNTNTFSNCSALTQVNLPLVQAVDASGFYSCGKLRTVSLPSTSILGASAFYYCASLQTLELSTRAGAQLTTVGNNCFLWASTETTDLTIGAVASDIKIVGTQLTVNDYSKTTYTFQSITQP